MMFNQGWDLVMKGYMELKWLSNIVLITFVYFFSEERTGWKILKQKLEN